MVTAIAVGMMLTSAACGGGSGSSSSSDTTDTQPVVESTTTVTSSPDDWAATSCVWRWFDRWDVTVAAPTSVAAGTTVELRVSLFEGNVSSNVGAVGSLTVDGSGPQVVEVHVAPLTWLDPKQIEASLFSELSPGPGTACEVSVGDEADGQSLGSVEMTADVDPPAADGTPLGDLVAAVDSTDAPMFALAELLWLQPEPVYDRLWLATSTRLDSITVTTEGTCRSIWSQYPGAMVIQQHGCEAALPAADVTGFNTVTVPDEHWAIVVSGREEDVAAVLDELQPFDVPNGEVAEGPPIPTQDEWLDGYFADHTDIVELGRFDWHDGKISIVGRTSADEPIDYLLPVSIGVGNYGSAGTQCEEYTFASSTRGDWTDAPPGGYAWFVARDPGTVFTLSTPGLPTTVALQQAPSGEFVGFLDIGEVELLDDLATVTDADGNPVPCTQ